MQPPYKYTYKYIIYIFLYFIRNHVARHSISYSRPRLSGAFLIYVVCKMSGTPKSDNENVKLLLTGQLWTMGLYEYIVCAILFPPITVLYSHMFWHRGLSGVWHHQTMPHYINHFKCQLLIGPRTPRHFGHGQHVSHSNSASSWSKRLASQPASCRDYALPLSWGNIKKKKHIKLIRYLSLRRQSQSAQAFSS